MNEDLKKKAQELINKAPEAKSAVILVDQGEQSAAIIAGCGKDIINLLANTLKRNKQVKEMFELAYFAVSESSK